MMNTLDKKILKYEGLRVKKIGDSYYISLFENEFSNVCGFQEEVLIPNGLDLIYSNELDLHRVCSISKPDDVKVTKRMMKKIFKNFPKKCNGCEKFEGPSERFQVCSGCRSVKYCSKECQVKDWKRVHKKICLKL